MAGEGKATAIVRQNAKESVSVTAMLTFATVNDSNEHYYVCLTHFIICHAGI
jgi:hypothetical protein